MKRPLVAPSVVWALPGLGLLAWLLGHLLRADAVSVARDALLFHLPLRSLLGRAAAAGELPWWNPLLHGGQPVLSNPNYAAFYPPTWMALPLAPHQGLALLTWAHLLLALVGAWRLLRRLGAESPAAGLGATAFAGGSWFVALPHSFNLFCGTAWLPWLLLAARPLLEERRPPARAFFATGAVLAVQLLAGEPVSALVGGLFLLCLAVGLRRPRALARLAVVAGLAATFGAVQLVPTTARLAHGPRAGGLPDEQALKWSAPPARLAELAFPHAWGHPLRDEEGLYFGWRLHDASWPYLVSLYAGFLPLVLAIGGLVAGPVPWRGGWALAAGLGVVLGTGRFDPLYRLLLADVFPFSALRYPEKLLLLTTASVALAGGLGWQRLIEARRRGEVERWRLPAALAGAAALFAAAGALWFGSADDPASAWIVRNGSGLLDGPAIDRARSFLAGQWARCAVVAGAVGALLALVPRRRIRSATLGALALGLLVADLAWAGRGLVPTLPAGEVLAPPPLLAALAPGTRLHVPLDEGPALHPRVGRPGFHQVFGRLQRLDPYVANLWGVPYALHRDYDLMLTEWGSRALDAYAAAPPAARPLVLAAWNVGGVVRPRRLEAMMAEARATGRVPAIAELVPVAPLPRFRSLPTALAVPPSEADRALAAQGWQVARQEVLLSSGSRRLSLVPASLEVRAEGAGEIRLDVDAPGPALVVAAVTFDPGWTARMTGRRQPLPTAPTALGQLAVELPDGGGELVLRYRDPWVGVGAALTLGALFAATLVLVRGPRERRR